MGNHHSGGYTGRKPRKNVHWKTAERPSSPSKPEIIPIASEDEPNAVTLKWGLPKHDGGAPLQGFQVECNRIGSPTWIHTSPPIVTKPELILTGLEPGFRYQFRVSAVNAVNVSEPSELSDILTISTDRTALSAPKFLNALEDVTCLENEKTEFRVTFDGIPAPTIAWFKDGFEIFSSRRTAITTDDNSSVLVFHQTLLTDEGEVKCTATNRAGHVVAKARLQLEAAPKLRYPRQYEEGLLYETSETIFLKTSVVGKPTPEVEWRHDGHLLASDERIEIANTTKFSILRIHTAQRSDRGEYQIHAKNKIGEDTAAFLVTITAPPDPPRKIAVTRQVDKSVTLTWSPPEDDGGCRVGNYIIEYYRSGWNVWLKATTSRKLSATLFDLIEGSEYRFRVKAESPYGMSEPSQESAVVRIPGKSVDMDFLAIESRIINDALVKEDGDEVLPTVSPRRKRTASSKESSSEHVREAVELHNVVREEPVVRRRKLSFPNDTTRRDKSPVGSTEFMLVLCPEGEKTTAEKRKSFQLDLEDALSPPPISFSAPDLGSRCIPFSPIRNCVSSTELLHERAMDRFYRAVAIEEVLKAKKKESRIAKVVEKPISTENHKQEDSSKPSISKPFIKPEIFIKSDSIEGKEYSYDNLRDSETLTVKDVNKWQSISFDEDYTASTVSTDSEHSDEVSLDAEMDRQSQVFSDEQLTYNPRGKPMRVSPQKDEKSLEIINIPAPLPDPNFIPKPILKRRENEQTNVLVSQKKPEKSTFFKKITKMPLQKSFPFSKRDTKKESRNSNTNSQQLDANKPNIIKDKLNAIHDDKELDEGKIVIEYYGNIVKEFGSHKKPSTPLYLNTEDLKKVAEKQDNNDVKKVAGKQNNNKNKQTKQKKSNDILSNMAPKRKPRNCIPPKSSKKTIPKPSPLPNSENISNPSNSESTPSRMKNTARATIVIPIDYEELEQQAKVTVRSVIDYTVDLCLLLLAFWFYFFKDERLAIPFLVLIIYRQVQEVVFRNIPTWIRQHTPMWLKSKNS